jgi:hypothetical protein
VVEATQVQLPQLLVALVVVRLVQVLVVQELRELAVKAMQVVMPLLEVHIQAVAVVVHPLLALLE